MSSVDSTHRSVRLSSNRPAAEHSNSGRTIASPPGSARYPSTARPSIDTNMPEQNPLLTSIHFHKSHAGEHSEQIWSSSHSQGAQRIETKNGRGIVSPRASTYDQANWRSVVQNILGYQFRDVDLLEEALESPGSGVTCVGTSHRHFLDGNTGLANVGGTVMKLVLREQCYLFQIPQGMFPARYGSLGFRRLTESTGDAEGIIERIIGRSNLNRVGMNTKLQQYVRPRIGVRPSQKHNILALFKDDFKRASAGADSSRQIANGIMAIIGATHFDGGIDSARRVMAQLGLIIKLP